MSAARRSIALGRSQARAARDGRGARGRRPPPPLIFACCLDGAGLLFYLRLVEVAALGRLVLVVDAGEGLFDRILGRRVEHLRLHRRVVVRPRDEDELVGGRARLGVDLDVEDRVAALTVGQGLGEILKRGALLALRIDRDELLVIGDLENDEL